MSSPSRQLALQVDKAIEVLKAGGIVIYPTDTVYGLGCDAFNHEAVEKIYKVKRRPFSQPLPVLLADSAQIAMVVGSVPELAWFLIRRFWPGGLTLVLPKATSFPELVTAGGKKVAIRIPNHAVPLKLISGLGRPIIGTSANVSNQHSPVTAEAAAQQLGGEVDLIIDAGRCPGGLESTVVDVTGEELVILRKGIIPEDKIKQACKEYAEEIGKGAYRFGV